MLTWLRKQSPDDESEVKSFWEHLEDLRRTLWKSIFTLGITFLLTLGFADKILSFLTRPLRQVTDRPENFLQSLNVADSFVLPMKIAFYAGLLLAAPAILFFIGQFILPALRQQEKQALWPGFFWGTLLFISGVATCYYLMVPQTLRAFIRGSHWFGIEPRWTIDSYISFVTQFMLMCGVTFEIPLVLVILVRVGVLSYNTVRKSRKILIFVAFAISSFLAPPDPMSMIVMGLPLVILFEIAIWLSWFAERRRNLNR